MAHHILTCWLCNLEPTNWQPMRTPADIRILIASKDAGFTAASEASTDSRLLFCRADSWQCILAHSLGPLCQGGPPHRPSIMARRSSPLLLALVGWSTDSVNSPIIFASSALTCWSWKTLLSTVPERSWQGCTHHTHWCCIKRCT